MKKKFDAVQFQRKVREELGKKYLSDPKAFARELRTKYAAEKGSIQERLSKNNEIYA